MHVCAVTVAYDKPEDLARLLSSLEAQPSLCGLIVLDNSRTAYFEDNEAIFHVHAGRYEFARYIRPLENVGSAGGFSIGMKTAKEQGFDWVWLLDQDGTVQSGCLASLLRNADRGDILCPQIVDISDPSVVLPQSGAVQNFWGRIVWQAFTVSRDISFFGTHGALVSKKALDKIGYYDPRYFFTGSEDLDYAFRLTSEHMLIRLIVEAKAHHPDARYRSGEKKSHLAEKGVIDSISAERSAASVDHLRSRALRGAAVFVRTRVAWLLPEHLGYVSGNLMTHKNCRKGQGLTSLSFAYLGMKRLTQLQLAAACLYSIFTVLFRKILSGNRISLKKSIKMYSICLLSKLTKEWPFESVEQFCTRLVG